MLKDPIQEAFEEFHKENPRVYEYFVRFALNLKERGLTKGSAKLIVERIRWEVIMETTADDFKINNNYTSRLARKAMDENHDLVGFFELRKLQPKVYSDILIPA